MANNVNNLLSQSENFKEEYCAQVVKVGKPEPVENSDNLVKVTVGGGYQVVVGKNDVKEGEVMVYAKLETAINEKFLSVNNQFELGERQRNSNYEEVQALIDAGKEDEAKRMVGYFNKHGRVRIVKLRGCVSEGVLFTIESIAKWHPEILQYDFEQCFQYTEDGQLIPFNFDTIGKDLFLKVYMPPQPQERIHVNGRARKNRKYDARILKLDRMVEGQYARHYDTNKLEDSMFRIKPDTIVTITLKQHGTSEIIGNLLVKRSLAGPATELNRKRLRKRYKGALKLPTRYYWQRKVKKNKLNKLAEEIKGPYKLEYGNVTSSRNKIKNQYIDPDQSKSFYPTDVHSIFGRLAYPLLKPGMTLYGEICGYIPGTNTGVQVKPKVFDYGCEPGHGYLMPYRITETDPDGNKKEWELMDVYNWTLEQLKFDWTQDWLKPIVILYHGTLSDLYPNIDKDHHWQANVLQAMKNDQEHFGMELNEPLCKNKVPREGIVLRIDNDPRPEAWKLKCEEFRIKVDDKVFSSSTPDMESAEAYGTENNTL